MKNETRTWRSSGSPFWRARPATTLCSHPPSRPPWLCGASDRTHTCTAFEALLFTFVLCATPPLPPRIEYSQTSQKHTSTENIGVLDCVLPPGPWHQRRSHVTVLRTPCSLSLSVELGCCGLQYFWSFSRSSLLSSSRAWALNTYVTTPIGATVLSHQSPTSFWAGTTKTKKTQRARFFRRCECRSLEPTAAQVRLLAATYTPRVKSINPLIYRGWGWWGAPSPVCVEACCFFRTTTNTAPCMHVLSAFIPRKHSSHFPAKARVDPPHRCCAARDIDRSVQGGGGGERE